MVDILLFFHRSHGEKHKKNSTKFVTSFQKITVISNPKIATTSGKLKKLSRGTLNCSKSFFQTKNFSQLVIQHKNC